MVSLNAESAEANMLMGEALDEMKDHEGAIRQFRAAAKVNPKEPNVHFGLGYLLWTKGQYPEAAREFQAELGNEPQHLQAMLYLGDAKMQMNLPDEARPLLEKVVKADATNGMAHRDLGIIFAERVGKMKLWPNSERPSDQFKRCECALPAGATLSLYGEDRRSKDRVR